MKGWLARMFAAGIASSSRGDPIAWMEKWVRQVGSARSEKCDFSIYPWTRKPALSACLGDVNVDTFVKPVQGGGTGSGLAALCYWLAIESVGDIQYNWEDNAKAIYKWQTQIEPILKACKPVMDRAPSLLKSDGKWKDGQVKFPHCNFVCQGVHDSKNVDSDTIRFQINEELHNWEPGRYAKARNRTTAVWNHISFNISNAGYHGDQLHQAFLSGSQEHWEVPCPHCRKMHVLKAEWDKRRPDLGGLRYDADGSRYDDGSYNYNKIDLTIRYQMPCGGEARDDATTRRAMSLGGDYGAPRNPGALSNEVSYTLEAVSVDYIPWIKLIKEKHVAMYALRNGDPEPWWRYLTERESRFVNKMEDRPVVGSVVLNSKTKKCREGMPDRATRVAGIDWQRGKVSKGEMSHYWMVIRDFGMRGNSLLVWEGKLLDTISVVKTIEEHGVIPACVAIDSGDDTTNIYNLCLKQGYNAIKGSGQDLFPHKDGGRRIFQEEKYLHLMRNLPPSKEDPNEEAMFWHYSKPGLLERLFWLRGAEESKWEVPGDVSQDYQEHMEAWELDQTKTSRIGETTTEFVKRRVADHCFMCEAYCAMLAEIAGLISVPEKAVADVKSAKPSEVTSR